MFLGAAGAAAGGATAAAVGAGELHKTHFFFSQISFTQFFFFKSHHFFLSINISQQGQWLWRT